MNSWHVEQSEAEWMGQKRKWWEGSDRHYIYGGNRDTFSAMKAPRQWPLVLLLNIDWREDKRLVLGKVVLWEVKQGEQLSRVLLNSI